MYSFVPAVKGSGNAVLPSDSVQPAGPALMNSVINPAHSQEASPTRDQMEKSKNRVRKFFPATWKAVKRPFRHSCKNKVAPFVPSPWPNAMSQNPKINADDSLARETIRLDKPELKSGTIPDVPLLKAGVYPVNLGLRGGGPPGLKPFITLVNNKPKTATSLANSTTKADASAKRKTEITAAGPSPNPGDKPANPIRKANETSRDVSLPKPGATSASPKMKSDTASAKPKAGTDILKAIPKIKAGANPELEAGTSPHNPMIKPGTSPTKSRQKAGTSPHNLMIKPGTSPTKSRLKAGTSPHNPMIKPGTSPTKSRLKAGTSPHNPMIKPGTSPTKSRLKAGPRHVNPMMKTGAIPNIKAEVRPAFLMPKPGAVNPKKTFGVNLAKPKMTAGAVSKMKTDTKPASSRMVAGTIPKKKKDTVPKLEDNKNLVPVLGEYLYDQSKIIGRGSFGKVYEGFRKSDGKRVAIKFVNRRPRDRFIEIPHASVPALLAEVSLMLMLTLPPLSPNIIQMYDWWDDGKYLTLVMEYPHPCMTLRSFIRSHNVLSEEITHCLWVQLVRAVQDCWKHGVFHSDIHTGNILVNTDTLELKLIDFGVGDVVKRSGYWSEFFSGAQLYAPPEVFKREKYYPMSTSVWFLGCILYEMVHGCEPFPLCIPCIEMLKITSSSISKDLCDMLSKCLDMDSSKRPTAWQITRHPWFTQK